MVVVMGDEWRWQPATTATNTMDDDDDDDDNDDECDNHGQYSH